MRIAFIASLLCLLSVPLRADDGWTLETADFRHTPVVLSGFDASGARVIPAGKADPQLIAMDQFLMLERVGPNAPAASDAKNTFTLFLSGGDRVLGQPVSLQGESFVWESEALGKITFSIRQVQAISRLALPPDLNADRKEDQILLANHDSARGIVVGASDGKFSVQTGDGSTTSVPLDAITTVYFASATAKPRAAKQAFRITFADGSSLTAPSAVSDGQNLDLKLFDDSKHTVGISAVTQIEQLDGPVSYLASRNPASVEQNWYSGASLPTFMDQAVNLSGRDWPHSIVVHADSKVTFALDGAYKTFRTQFCIDPRRNAQSGVMADLGVRIWLDDKVACEVKSLRAGKIWPILYLDLGDAKQITLEVTHNDATATQGWFDWLQPALLRTAPPPAPATLESPANRPAAPGE